VTRAFLGLGSNQGDRLENLRRAVELLGKRGARLIRSSRVYETDPVGGPPQPDFLNAVAEVETKLSPRDLLQICQDVERIMGRKREARWGPRLIDLDILSFGAEEIDQPDLQVPHPRMHERAFVLVPLLELVADPRLPRGRRVASLRLDALSLDGVRLFAEPLAPPSG
jgi:2-amino-4-hydroxy-6-hydroxymethyldihydropteridine diphosphokinase